MTVSYNSELASVRTFGTFWRMLFRWRGSIYKLVLPDMAVYICVYYAISLPYRFALNENGRELFEQVIAYCGKMTNSIPMSFVLGFYVTIVVQRWWAQYLTIPWPDGVAVYVSANVQGTDDRGRLVRRTIIRYINLCFVYMMSQICCSIKRRFPTLDHFVEAGLMTELEKRIFETWDKKSPHMKYWMPTVWAGSIVVKARKEGRIRDDFAVKTLIDSINEFRGGVGGIIDYDWISVPLVYTQTVTLAVYTFFMAEMMARQFSIEKGKLDLYIPIFSFISFFFYMGWLRVAETLFNPFGDDDDDFEINWLIDRNLQVSYLIVDEMHEEHPELVRDQYWEDVIPKELPYTEETEQFRKEPTGPDDEPPRIFQPLNMVIIDEDTDKLAGTWSKQSKTDPGTVRFQGLSQSNSSKILPSNQLSQPTNDSSEFAATQSHPIMHDSSHGIVVPTDTSTHISLKAKDSVAKRAMKLMARKIAKRVMHDAEAKVQEQYPEADEALDDVLEHNLNMQPPASERDMKDAEEPTEEGMVSTKQGKGIGQADSEVIEILPASELREVETVPLIADHLPDVEESAQPKQLRFVARGVRHFVPEEYTFLLEAIEEAESTVEPESQDSRSMIRESAAKNRVKSISSEGAAVDSYGDREPTEHPTLNQGAMNKFFDVFTEAIGTISEAVYGSASPPEPPIPPPSSIHHSQQAISPSQPSVSRAGTDMSEHQRESFPPSKSLSANQVATPVAGATVAGPDGNISEPKFLKRLHSHEAAHSQDMQETDSSASHFQERVIREESFEALGETPFASEVMVPVEESSDDIINAGGSKFDTGIVINPDASESHDAASHHEASTTTKPLTEQALDQEEPSSSSEQKGAVTS